MPKKQTVSTKRISLVSLMHMTVGLLFLVQGIHGLASLNTQQSPIGQSLSKAFGGNTVYLELIMALLLTGCGVVITASYFMNIDARIKQRAWLVILTIWVMLMVVLDIILPNFHSRFFDWLAWAQQLLFHSIVLLSILIVRKQ